MQNAITPWLLFALGELGQREVPGASSNPRIQEYLKTVINSTAGIRDETPWCSAFVAWCLRQAGIEHRAGALAQSWRSQLTPLAAPRLGAVAVFWRGAQRSWQGHVGFFLQERKQEILLLGGNQDDGVSIKAYPRAQLLGYRWPAGY